MKRLLKWPFFDINKSLKIMDIFYADTIKAIQMDYYLINNTYPQIDSYLQQSFISNPVGILELNTVIPNFSDLFIPNNSQKKAVH